MINYNQQLKDNTKKVFRTLFWCAISVLIFIVVDRGYLNYDEPIMDTHKYTYEDITTSLTEDNQLIITDRITGLYKIYSDSVLIGIHGMYSTYIAKDFQEKTKKK